MLSDGSGPSAAASGGFSASGVVVTPDASAPTAPIPVSRSGRTSKPLGTGAPLGRLISVHRDGTDGEIFTLLGDMADVGRAEGLLRFPDDRFLASRHARLERRGAEIIVTPLDVTNGVFVKLRSAERHGLVHGDVVLLGKEVLRFEVLGPEERGQAPAIQHGVHVFASPPRLAWGRLVQIVPSGVARDILHLTPPEVLVGRDEGDVRFPDDEFMSRRHARITNRNGHFELIDLGSSNGTFVRLRGERGLQGGDHIRMGDELFRFEPLLSDNTSG
jgi:pSer/pThr/pTyr-binding forkhead associated (FHA) protein